MFAGPPTKFGRIPLPPIGCGGMPPWTMPLCGVVWFDNRFRVRQVLTNYSPLMCVFDNRGNSCGIWPQKFCWVVFDNRAGKV